MKKILFSAMIIFFCAALSAAFSDEKKSPVSDDKNPGGFIIELSFGSSLMFLEQPILKNGEIVSTDNLFPVSSVTMAAVRL